MINVTKLDCLMRVVPAEEAKVEPPAERKEREPVEAARALARTEPGGRLAPVTPHSLRRR